MVIYHPWFCVLFSSASLSVPFKALCALQSEHCWREWKGPEQRLRPTGLSWLQLSPITMAQCADRLHRINFLREHTVTSVCQDYPACIHGHSGKFHAENNGSHSISLPWVTEMVTEPTAKLAGPVPGPCLGRGKLWCLPWDQHSCLRNSLPWAQDSQVSVRPSLSSAGPQSC